MPTRGRFILLALLLLWIAPTCSAQAGDAPFIEDIEDVPTPTSLADLLPTGGIHAVDIGFWLIFQTPDGEGNTRDSMYMYWCAEPRNGQLVFEHIYGSDRGGKDGAGFHYRKRLIYSAAGAFVSYTADLQLGAGARRYITGKIVGDALVLTTFHTDGWGGYKTTISEREVPRSTFDAAVPVEWMPMVIAYHIRKGSLGYGVTTLEFATGQFGDTRVEDLGTEVHQHHARLHNAHFLAVDINVRSGTSRRKETMKLLTAKDGNYFKLFYQGSERSSVRRSSIDEVVKVFGVEQARPDMSDRFNPLARLRAALE